MNAIPTAAQVKNWLEAVKRQGLHVSVRPPMTVSVHTVKNRKIDSTGRILTRPSRPLKTA